jgi:hypothetical protein
MTDEIVEYIRRNRATYTKEALTQKLLEAGHSQFAIDAAFAAAERGETAPGPDRRAPVAILIVVAYVATWLALVALTPMATRTYGIGPFILAVTLTVAALFSLWLIAASRALRSGQYLAWAAVISVAMLVGVAGLCVPFAGIGSTP